MILKDFRIKLESLYVSERQDWHPEAPKLNVKTGKFSIECGCGQEIIGNIIDGWIHVEEMDLSGEGSGTFWREIMTKAIESSKGEMSATFIWEGGDHIEKIIVKDGIITEKEVEL